MIKRYTNYSTYGEVQKKAEELTKNNPDIKITFGYDTKHKHFIEVLE